MIGMTQKGIKAPCAWFFQIRQFWDLHIFPIIRRGETIDRELRYKKIISAIISSTWSSWKYWSISGLRCILYPCHRVGNLWPPRGHYLCHCSMVDDDTSRNHNRKTDRASENPSGTPRQCISVCPWKLAQPIAGYRRNTRLILNPQWHKKAACSFSYLFCCAGALCTMLEFLFIFVLRELDTWTWTWTIRTTGKPTRGSKAENSSPRCRDYLADEFLSVKSSSSPCSYHGSTKMPKA